jgi:hypothetical protein
MDQAAAFGGTKADECTGDEHTGRTGTVAQPQLYSYDGIVEIQQPR